MIQLENLSKYYGKVAAVDGLSLVVEPGEVFGFLGPNGAGKTTTIRVMMGILKPSSGRARLGGYDVAREPEKAKAIAGFVPDRPFIYEKLSGREFLRFVGSLHRMNAQKLESRLAELLERFELWEWKDDLVEGYSHGMKQRLVMCASLLHQPRILIVDEPMVGIDPKGTRMLKDLFLSLGKSGASVFLSTHSIGLAEEICQRVGIIHRGKLIAIGAMAELYRMARVDGGGLESAFLELTSDRNASAPGAERA